MTSPRVQILDACVLINLLASGEIGGVLGAAARESSICSAVEKETIFLRTDDPSAPLELIKLDPLLESGSLTVCHVEGDLEAQLYVDYAGSLDDGEAMSVAIALSRGFTLATDERKARRLFSEAAGDARRLTSTPELMRLWAESGRVPAQALKAALFRIEARARYQPPTSDPNHGWWVGACR